MVDLGGSLAVASRGLFATGVSTDLNGMYATRLLLETRRGDRKVLMTVDSHLPKLWRQNWRFDPCGM